MRKGRRMLGHTVNDLRDMQYAIEEGVFYLPPSYDTSRLNLQKAWDMIEGLIEEKEEGEK